MLSGAAIVAEPWHHAWVGDYFERIVDVEVGAAEAEALGARVVDWMVARGLLTRGMSSESMYSSKVETGYVPGAQWAGIADNWGADWLPGPVAVIVGRHAHHGGQGETEPEYATCPHCATRTVIIDYPNRWEADPAVWQPFTSAIEEWVTTGAGDVTCRTCRTSVPINGWTWSDDFALGALAVEFWHWPPLHDTFVSELATQLGHRTVHHTGKF